MSGIAPAVVAVALALGSASSGHAAAQEIQLRRSTSGSPSGAPEIRLLGFAPNSEVEVSFTRSAPDGLPPSFRSSASYRIGSDGNLDLTTAPIAGDWSSSSPEAPFWTMRPDTSAPTPDPRVVLIEVKAGAISRRTEFQLPHVHGVTIQPVAAFAGAFLAMPTRALGPLPLIIVLGGSGGDDRTARHVAPLLAAEGFAVLGLPYISPDRGAGQAIVGLPSAFSRIPVERLEDVHRWAVADPRVDAERVGLWGVSKGGEFAIVAAAHFPWLDAVAAIVPSDVVWEGFSYSTPMGTGTPSFALHGRDLPFIAYSAPGRGRDVKEAGRRADPQRAAAARIPIENFAGLLLVAGGELDRSWDSAGMSQSIAERRAEAGRTTISMIFADAGHDLDPTFLDPIEADAGSAEAIGRAKLDVWNATVEMFRSALGESRPDDRWR
jgi:poly(3-hydroxybutyrate) depolymerase